MKIIDKILKIVLGLLFVSPILGAFGVFPEPTADMYTNMQAYDFIMSLYNVGYMMPLMTVVYVVALWALITRRNAFANLIIFPITLNIICFHAFLDGGLFSAGAIMADVFFLINVYFLYKYRNNYKDLFNKRG